VTSKPKVYIVILTWGQRKVTADCLRSVLALDYPAFDVVIVDNNSPDDTVEYVRSTFPQVMVLENERNLGYAAGCNIGIRYALEQSADYLLLLNNDTLVQPNLVNSLTSWAETHPSDAALTPLICYADDPKKVWFAGSNRNRLTLDSEDFILGQATQQIATEKDRQVDYVMGCAIFIRAKVLRQVGLFDESLFMYYEDMDLSLRIQAAGYKLRYVPGSTVLHRVEASTADVKPLRYYYRARASVHFFRKHVHGLHWLIVVPYRLGSSLKTLVKLLSKRQTPAAIAHLQGLRDGLRGHYAGERVINE
jgi:GT2 family glycosyltransferase